MKASQQTKKRDPRFKDPQLCKARSTALKKVLAATGFGPENLASIMVKDEDAKVNLFASIRRYLRAEFITPLRFCVLAEKALGAEEGSIYVFVHEKEKDLFDRLKVEHSLSDPPKEKVASKRPKKKGRKKSAKKKDGRRRRGIRERECVSVPATLAAQRLQAIKSAMEKGGLENSYQVARKAHNSGSREVRSLDMKLRRVLQGKQPLTEIFAVEIAPLLGVAPSDLIVSTAQESSFEPTGQVRPVEHEKTDGQVLSLQVVVPEIGLQGSSSLVHRGRKFVPENTEGGIDVNVDGTKVTIKLELPPDRLLQLFID